MYRFRERLRAILFLFLLLAIVPLATAQPPSITGSVHVYNPSGQRPYPAGGYEVFLWFGRMWSFPVVTDSYGRFAFYNVRPGSYLLRIYNRNRVQVWEQNIIVPIQLTPIVLPRP